MSNSDRTSLVTTVVRGNRARDLLDDPDFVEEWLALWNDCPWSTVYQSEKFTSIWYTVYRDVYEPVVIAGRAGGRLAGLFLLALPDDQENLVHVGSHQAEYQAWLALPDWSLPFLLDALTESRRLGAAELRLHFSAPKLPLGWAKEVTRSGFGVKIVKHERGFMHVGSDSSCRASLKKRGNRSKLARLGRDGAVSFVQYNSGSELAEVIDSIADFCDLRQGAVHDVTPFYSDPRKKDFYLALADRHDLLHATALVVGSAPVAAHIGCIEKDYVSLGVIAHSPFAAANSPGKLILHLLGCRLDEQGYEVFDLTPGGAYKSRFTDSSDEVPSIVFFLTRWSRLRARARRYAVAAATRVERASGLDIRQLGQKSAARMRLLRRAARYPHRVGPAIVQLLGRRLHYSGEVRIYGLRVEDAIGFEIDRPRLRMNCLEDLLCYQPVALSDPPRSEFLAEALNYLEAGQAVFTRTENGLLLHTSWLVKSTEEIGSEHGHELVFNEGSAVLWKDYTHPAARGRGLHQESIKLRARYVAKEETAPLVVAGVLADNGPSRHNFETLGFECLGSAFVRTRWGKSRRWTTGAFLERSHQA